jgi:molecular chaperone GrpE
VSEEAPTEQQMQEDVVSSGVNPDVTDVDGNATASAGLDLEARAEADPRSRAELLSELDQVEAQRDEYLDDLRRAHADFENYRKRVARDGAVQREQGRADVVSALLDALDDLDRIVAAAEVLDAPSLTVDIGAVASGVRVVAEKAQRTLAGLGVERVEAVGVPFDPTVHDAVQQVAAERDGTGGADGLSEGPVVHEVLRPGYRLPDRVLRPAMVVVAQ